jgi:Arc/MetJ family transcription regulator
MEIQIAVDAELLETAKAATGLQTERAVVEEGLRALLQLKAQERFRELRGKIVWDGDFEDPRSSRIDND